MIVVTHTLGLGRCRGGQGEEEGELCRHSFVEKVLFSAFTSKSYELLNARTLRLGHSRFEIVQFLCVTNLTE